MDLFSDLFFLDYKIIKLLLLMRGGAVAIAAIAYSSLTPEERRHTVKLGVSKRPGLNSLISPEWLGREAR
jgi:hypothetical protein